ncbi:hypothetical protein FA15DRAFT_473851 [Coprinopsis marcescibilis]|uniref:Uncharacterized protein n=1 Tax=Coprinopsis marcescibilis TaxID=230819 RepID=A0A5C3KRU8_COPMA|nr:hypothetical protein FA15DRAFT_473851 [Coprinopsis marcescibilis]
MTCDDWMHTYWSRLRGITGNFRLYIRARVCPQLSQLPQPPYIPIRALQTNQTTLIYCFASAQHYDVLRERDHRQHVH